MKVRDLVRLYTESLPSHKRCRAEAEFRMYARKIFSIDVREVERHYLLRVISESKTSYSAYMTADLIQKLFAFAVEYGLVDPFVNPAERLQVQRPRNSKERNDLR